MSTIKIFVAEDCQPCGPIKQMGADLDKKLEVSGARHVGLGDVNVEMVDVLSDEGYPQIERYGLEHVPSAVIDGDQGWERCAIQVDLEQGVVRLLCGDENEEPASP